MTSSLNAAVTDVDFSLVMEASDGRQFRFQRGSSTLTTSYESASTSKMVTAAMILSLVERGFLTLDSRPQDYLSYWTTSTSSPMSRITLRHLLSFTSGMRIEPTCVNNPLSNMDSCVQSIQSSNLSSAREPGSEFYYSSIHLQVAGMMALRARGYSNWGQVFDEFKTRTQLFAHSVYDLPSANNPRLAGGMHWTAEDYHQFLKALYKGQILGPSTMSLFLADQLNGVTIAYSPAKSSIGEDWHYGLGHWIECWSPSFNCSGIDRISTPGSYGAYPFIDYQSQFFGILARQGDQNTFRNGNALFRTINDTAVRWATRSCTPALSLSQLKSVSIYDYPRAEYSDLVRFEQRLVQVKKLGLNTVWLVVPWIDLEPNVGTTPNIDIGAAGYDGTVNSANLTAVKSALRLIKKYGLNVMWSVDYLGEGWSPKGVDPTLLIQGTNLQFFLRYAKYVAQLVKSEQMSPYTWLLLHDEGVLGPYDKLWTYADIQQSYRNYLYGRDPNLTAWNSRWGKSYTSWDQIKTFSFNHAGYLDPELQDTVGFINWTMARTVGNGSFANAVKAAAPGVRVGFHYTYFNFLNTLTGDYTKLDQPLSTGHGFDFVSFPLYDSEPIATPFRKEVPEYLTAARAVFPTLPIFFGELGSVICAVAGDCTLNSDSKLVASTTLEARQAQFIGRNVSSLLSQNVGFNLWTLHDFAIDSTEGLLGLLRNDGTTKSSGTFVSTLIAGQPVGLNTVKPVLSTGGVSQGYSPWAVWIQGSQLDSQQVAMLIVKDQVWAKNVPISVASDKTWLSFGIPSNQLPQSCNASAACPMQVILWNPNTGVYSSPLVVSVPRL